MVYYMSIIFKGRIEDHLSNKEFSKFEIYYGPTKNIKKLEFFLINNV